MQNAPVCLDCVPILRYRDEWQQSEGEHGDLSMRIALTGATGFIGRYIAENLAGQGHQLRCLCRPTSDRSGLEHLADSLQCVTGDLDDGASCQALVEDCEAVVHAACFTRAADSAAAREISWSSSIRMFWARSD
jgi:putative NADH-flavin reductase